MLWAILVITTIASDEKPLTPDIHRVRQVISGQKGRAITTLTKELKALEEGQKRVPRDRNRKKALADYKTKIDAVKKKIEWMESGRDKPPLPELFGLGGEQWEVGSFGTFGGHFERLVILDILSPTESVGRFHYSLVTMRFSEKDGGGAAKTQPEESMEVPVALKASTISFANGTSVSLNGCYRVSGRRQWRGKTLFVFEPFDAWGFISEHEDDKIK